jgi:hypothetical protein
MMATSKITQQAIAVSNALLEIFQELEEKNLW